MEDNEDSQNPRVGEGQQQFEEIIDICGLLAEKRLLRCRWGDIYKSLEVSSEINIDDLYAAVNISFKFDRSEVLCLSYLFNDGPFVRLRNDRDVMWMMRSQLKCRARHIDIVIERNVGGSGGLCDSPDIDSEDSDDMRYPEMGDEERSTSHLSSIWGEYIKGVGQVFDGGVKEFRVKLEMYAAEMGFQYVIIKNKPNKFTAECKRKVEEMCQWRIHASARKSDGSFLIKKLNNEHTCSRMIRHKSNSELSSKVISSVIVDEVRKRPGVTAKEVVDFIGSVYKFQVPYYTTYYALDSVKKSVVGDGASSFARLERYIEMVKNSNPGSHCVMECDSGSRRFKRVFVALDACIRGFQMCRPLLCLDGTFLSSKYKGTLLAAVGKDANQGLYPLAYAVVSAENNDNWKWFVEQLAVIINRYPRQITFMSDRNLGLVNDVRQVFPDSPHAFCYNHIKSNLESRFLGLANAAKRASVLEYFERAAYATDEDWFTYNYNKLVAVDPARVNVVFGGTDLSNWANFYFQGDRFGDMCSNAAESFNSLIRKERLLPVTELLDGIRVKLMRRIAERAGLANRTVTFLTPKMEKLLVDSANEARVLEVIKASEAEFEVTEGRRTFVVNVVVGSCSCGFWGVNKFPCKHTASVFRRVGLNIYPFIDSVFFTSSFRMCYMHTIHPVVNDPYDIVDVDGRDPVMPPMTTRPAGRPPTRRRRSRVELIRQIKCGRCGKSTGHNRKTCTEPID